MEKKDLIKQWLKARAEKFHHMREHRGTVVRVVKWALLAIVLMFTIGVAAVILFIFPSLPDIDNIQNLVAAQSSAIYDKDGGLLYTIHGEENRKNVSLSDVSQDAIESVLAIEDDQFYNHGGVDYSAILKAVCSEMRICSTPRGGSTITQQFIKNAFLSSERTYSRKLKEIILALRLEGKFTKDQILEMYLNRIPYGSSIYGIERAANTFFGKSAKDLTLAEGAVLASIPKAPTFYSPYGNNKYASINLDAEDIIKMNIRTEQDLAMISQDFINKGLLSKTYTYSESDTEEINDEEEEPDSESDEVTDEESDEEDAMEEPESSAEHKIYVSGRVDYVLGRMKELGYITEDEFDDAIKEAENIQFKPYIEEIKAPHFVMYIKELIEQKYGKEQVEKGGLKITTTLDPKLQETAEKAMETYAKTNLEKYKANNASLVATDPSTGQILAMVGSVDYWNDDIDGKVNVTLRPRLPGSSFKPIVYAAAFLQGYAPSTVLYDVDTKFGAWYQPKNYDGKTRGPVTMREALGNSLNIPAVKAAYLAGVPNVLDLARKMGIQLNQPDDWYGLSLALGAGEVRLLDMAGAFSIFANGGYKMDPVAILKIEDRNGNILEEYSGPSNKTLILDPQAAYLINDVLSDAEARPEGYWRQMLTIPGQTVAAKTGTSNKEIKNVDYPVDNWTVGYTRRIVTGVWVGNNDSSILGPTADGISTAARIWHDFMAEATKDNPREPFTRPEGIKWVKVSKRTGKLPAEQTPEEDIVSGVFASFSVPTEYESSFKLVKIDKASGKLATEYTPESAIEEKAFFEHHSEFPDNPQWEEPVRKWAEENGEDEAAPTEYDDVHTAETDTSKPSIVITSPTSLSAVSGPYVGVLADVSSKNGINYVEYYWDDTLAHTAKVSPYKGSIKIPDEGSETGSSHTIKAIAYDTLYNSSQSSVDVKIGADKTAPVVTITYPADGDPLDAGSSISVQANAYDTNGDIDEVEFYLDDKLQSTDSSSPYVWQFSVPAALGTYELKAVAYDYSKNQASSSINITTERPDTTVQSGSSAIMKPYKNQYFDEGDRILIQAALNQEAQDDLKELVVLAKKKGSKSIEVAKTQGDSETGGVSAYTFIWDAVPAGTYELSLKITLQDGTIRYSERVSIVVR